MRKEVEMVYRRIDELIEPEYNPRKITAVIVTGKQIGRAHV